MLLSSQLESAWCQIFPCSMIIKTFKKYIILYTVYVYYINGQNITTFQFFIN